MPISGVQQIFMAGGGSQAFRAGGVLYWQNPAVANAADNLWVNSTAYSLPAGTMATNGDQLVIEAWCDFSASSDSKARIINIGYSAYDASQATPFTAGVALVNSASVATSATNYSRAVLTRLSATTGGYSAAGFILTTTTLACQNILYASGSLTWANALNILMAVRDATATGVAAVVTLQELRITYLPR